MASRPEEPARQLQIKNPSPIGVSDASLQAELDAKRSGDEDQKPAGRTRAARGAFSRQTAAVATAAPAAKPAATPSKPVRKGAFSVQQQAVQLIKKIETFDEPSGPDANGKDNAPSTAESPDEQGAEGPPRLVGSWKYGKKPTVYSVSRVDGGSLRFDGTYSTIPIWGLLEPQDSFFVADLSTAEGIKVGTIRLSYNAEEEKTVSNFRSPVKVEWGKDIIAERASEEDILQAQRAVAADAAGQGAALPRQEAQPAGEVGTRCQGSAAAAAEDARPGGQGAQPDGKAGGGPEGGPAASSEDARPVVGEAGREGEASAPDGGATPAPTAAAAGSAEEPERQSSLTPGQSVSVKAALQPSVSVKAALQPPAAAGAAPQDVVVQQDGAASAKQPEPSAMVEEAASPATAAPVAASAPQQPLAQQEGGQGSSGAEPASASAAPELPAPAGEVAAVAAEAEAADAASAQQVLPPDGREEAAPPATAAPDSAPAPQQPPAQREGGQGSSGAAPASASAAPELPAPAAEAAAVAAEAADAASAQQVPPPDGREDAAPEAAPAQQQQQQQPPHHQQEGPQADSGAGAALDSAEPAEPPVPAAQTAASSTVGPEAAVAQQPLPPPDQRGDLQAAVSSTATPDAPSVQQQEANAQAGSGAAPAAAAVTPASAEDPQAAAQAAASSTEAVSAQGHPPSHAPPDQKDAQMSPDAVAGAAVAEPEKPSGPLLSPGQSFAMKAMLQPREGPAAGPTPSCEAAPAGPAVTPASGSTAQPAPAHAGEARPGQSGPVAAAASAAEGGSASRQVAKVAESASQSTEDGQHSDQQDSVEVIVRVSLKVPKGSTMRELKQAFVQKLGQRKGASKIKMFHRGDAEALVCADGDLIDHTRDLFVEGVQMITDAPDAAELPVGTPPASASDAAPKQVQKKRTKETAQEGDVVEVLVKDSQRGGDVRLAVPASATMLDVKKALLLKTGRGDPGSVHLLSSDGSGCSKCTDTDKLGSLRRFVLVSGPTPST